MTYDREFDGIVIGGGHQALVCAAYMANAGYEILVLERNLEVGGGVRTEDPTNRGYRFNMHSNAHWDITGTPWYNDLELEKHGVDYIKPRTEYGLPQQDGPPVVLSRDTDRTTEVISEVSEHDAEEFRRRREIAEELVEKVYLPQRFDEPLPSDDRRRLLESSDLGREFLDWTTESAFDLVADWFESSEVRLLVLHKLTIFGEPGEGLDNPSIKGGITRCFDGDRTYEVARGGSQMLALGLKQVIQQNGSTVMTTADVTNIDIEEGRAIGVTLDSGRTYGASEFIASGINPILTFQNLVDCKFLTENFVSEINAYDFSEWSTLTTHLALDEAPDYKAAETVPEINDSLYNLVGIEDMGDLMSLNEATVQKEVPPPGFLGSSLTQFDSTQAPDGQHVSFAMQAGSYDLHDDPAAWDDVHQRVRNQILEKWSEYAPNMTEENVVDTNVYTPHQITLTNPNMHNGCIMIGELNESQVLSNHFGYRTPIDNLYMCGSSVHPGGGINGGAGYVAAKIIHEDRGTEPWWNPVDARAALASLD